MILLLLFSQLMAQDVMIQSETTSDVVYEKHLLENPKLQSFIQHRQNQTSQKGAKLQELFKRAQFEFLQGSLNTAKELFNNIADKEHDSQWSQSDQKIIHYSFLRLAQLAPKYKSQMLKRAFLFNPKIQVDTQLFPPPLVDQYKQLRTSLPINIWALPTKAAQFTQVLINGRPLPPGVTFFRYRTGKVRLDFLSNQFQPLRIVTDLKELETLPLALHPIATGTCQSPEFHIKPSHNFRMLEGECLSGKGATKALQALKKWTPESLSPKQGPSLFKNKWFWIGISVLATGLTAHALSQQNDKGTPASPTNPELQEFSNNQ